MLLLQYVMEHDHVDEQWTYGHLMALLASEVKLGSGESDNALSQKSYISFWP